ncbi:MAG TPA: sensor histidine kinase, partial [Albitalea sp.]|nr:sensor histidine kinase [Albitalea sp.]
MAPDTTALATPRLPSVAWLRLRGSWRYAAAVLICIAIGIAAQRSFLAVQLDAQRDAARHRLEFFAKSLEALLERNEALPSLLALEG